MALSLLRIHPHRDFPIIPDGGEGEDRLLSKAPFYHSPRAYCRTGNDQKRRNVGNYEDTCRGVSKIASDVDSQIAQRIGRSAAWIEQPTNIAPTDHDSADAIGPWGRQQAAEPVGLEQFIRDSIDRRFVAQHSRAAVGRGKKCAVIRSKS